MLSFRTRLFFENMGVLKSRKTEGMLNKSTNHKVTEREAFKRSGVKVVGLTNCFIENRSFHKLNWQSIYDQFACIPHQISLRFRWKQRTRIGRHANAGSKHQHISRTGPLITFPRSLRAYRLLQDRCFAIDWSSFSSNHWNHQWYQFGSELTVLHPLTARIAFFSGAGSSHSVSASIPIPFHCHCPG